MEQNNNDLGKILKQQRLTIPLTLTELATVSRVSSSHLGRIERGERFPSARILRKIARPLGFSEGELFALADYLPPESISTNEGDTQINKLDPYVVMVLAQEPLEMQRAMLAIFSMIRYIAKGISQDNTPEKQKQSMEQPNI